MSWARCGIKSSICVSSTIRKLCLPQHNNNTDTLNYQSC